MDDFLSKKQQKFSQIFLFLLRSPISKGDFTAFSCQKNSGKTKVFHNKKSVFGYQNVHIILHPVLFSGEVQAVPPVGNTAANSHFLPSSFALWGVKLHGASHAPCTALTAEYNKSYSYIFIDKKLSLCATCIVSTCVVG